MVSIGLNEPRRLLAIDGAHGAMTRLLTYLEEPGTQLDVVEDGVVQAGRPRFARLVLQTPDSLTVAVRPAVPLTPGERAADLCRVVAAFWRQRAGLTTMEPRRESRLIDLTGVWLGFGTVLANGAQPHLFDGRQQLPAAGSRLSMQAVCFALAARLVAREASCLATWRLRRVLDRVPRRSLMEALLQLRRPRGSVAHRLKLPGYERFGLSDRLSAPGSIEIVLPAETKK
jgi:hypothetical protein